jgi:C4-dicarboxylate-specific signal transduction histidine kinase
MVIVRGNSAGSSGELKQLIHVLDNGAGISREAAAKLFRPFFTTKVNGTGLGLAVVQKILLQHGGQVEACNRSEGGAEFIVTLPAIRTVPEAVKLDGVAI